MINITIAISLGGGDLAETFIRRFSGLAALVIAGINLYYRTRLQALSANTKEILHEQRNNLCLIVHLPLVV